MRWHDVSVCELQPAAPSVLLLAIHPQPRRLYFFSMSVLHCRLCPRRLTYASRAESERNLLRFYDLGLPDVVLVSSDNLVTHTQS